MNVSLVLTLVGADRPGLVRALSAVVAAHDGNWLESRLARLGGQFAGIVRIQAPAARAAALTAALEALAAQGLLVVTHTDEPAVAPAAASAPRRRWQLEVVGHDRPGIVRDLSRTLAQHGVNVEELTSHCESAAMSGEPLFRAVAKLGLPQTCEIDELRRELESLAAGLMADFTIQPEL